MLYNGTYGCLLTYIHLEIQKRIFFFCPNEKLSLERQKVYFIGSKLMV